MMELAGELLVFIPYQRISLINIEAQRVYGLYYLTVL